MDTNSFVHRNIDMNCQFVHSNEREGGRNPIPKRIIMKSNVCYFNCDHLEIHHGAYVCVPCVQ